MTAKEMILYSNFNQKLRFPNKIPPYNGDWPCYYCNFRQEAKENNIQPDEVCKLCIHNMDWGK